MMENFIQSQNKVNQKHDEEFRQMNLRLDQLATHNKMLEHQIASQASSSDVDQTALNFLDKFDRVQVHKWASTGSNF